MAQNLSDYPDIIEVVRAILVADADIAATVGQSVFADHIPQARETPALIIWVSSEVEEDDLTGPTGFATARVQIDALGRSRGESVQLSRMARAALAGYRGVVDGVVVRSITQATGQLHLTDRAEVGSDHYRPVTTQDFFIHYLSNAKAI